MSVLFESDRDFQVWRAVVGHGQLLLRSTKTESLATRIDVVFKPVVAMKIRNTLRGLRVFEAGGDQADQIYRDAAQDRGPEFKAYVLEAGPFAGYVIASVMTHCEDDGEYGEPSQIFAGS